MLLATSVPSSVIYTIVPTIAIIVGGFIAAVRRPTPFVQSAVQHVAAGAVIAAVSTEIVPSIVHADQAWAVVIGFSAGTAAMLGIAAVSRRFEARQSGTRAIGLAAATVTDVVVDGVVLGLGFAAGQKEGLLLAVALTLELVFLGLSVATEISEAPRVVIGFSAGLAATFVVGVLIGDRLGNLPAGPFTAFLAFGSAALLYLVTEELLTETHERPDHPTMPALFLLAFLALLVVDMVA